MKRCGGGGRREPLRGLSFILVVGQGNGDWGGGVLLPSGCLNGDEEGGGRPRVV